MSRPRRPAPDAEAVDLAVLAAALAGALATEVFGWQAVAYVLVIGILLVYAARGLRALVNPR